MYSESYMSEVWRKAVRRKYHDRCAICGEWQGLECHHIIGRSRLLTRFDHRNGILLCVSCHKRAHEDPLIKHKVHSMVNLEHLSKLAMTNSKQYFAKHTISRTEYYKQQMEENKREALK